MKKKLKKIKKLTVATHPSPNRNGWIPWQLLHSTEIINCCDCGLSHEHQYRNKKGMLEWRAKRNKEYTKLARESYKIIIVK